jgi:hypothetical protein
MCALLLLVVSAPAQEVTGGMEGTVTDPSGAIVPGAHLVLTSPALVGVKEIDTDSKGEYRFANLPAGVYTVKVTAKGFEALVRGNLTIQVGGLPTVNLQLQLGASTTTVEVTSSAPLVDVTSNQNVTDLDTSTLNNVPHGLSYQSVIQFAPMARNEPLAGYTVMGAGNGGTGGSMPGSSGNGLTFGYMIGGAADSENQYLINGQDTEQVSGGYSKANVPFEFINTVNMETSGIQAEYGGALGGVVNVVTKSGSNDLHGSFFNTWGGSGVDSNNNNIFLEYNPLSTAVTGQDAAPQLYSPRKDHFTTDQPGFTLGGPIVKNRLWFFVGLAPQFNSIAKTVDFSQPTNLFGNQYFTQDQQTYYSTVRLDAAVTSKIRLYATFLDQYQRETGDTLPDSDPVPNQVAAGVVNPSVFSNPANYSHGLGFAAPNATYDFGADITISPRVISTTRFGYFFDDYHDFGWQTSVPNFNWATDGDGALGNNGAPLPGTPGSGLQEATGFNSAPYVSTFTPFNSDKHYQFNQDFAFIKSGWWGSHYFKVGYQLNKLENVISQNGNVPFSYVYAGNGASYSPSTTTGIANCAALIAEWGNCAGEYGYLKIQDFATILPEPAVDWNHALYAQDSWTVGHGLTFNLGIRVEKEDLPAPNGVNVPAIHFGWTQKVAPRLGVAWDPTGHGKMKLFASYGVVNDVMKLLLAQTSWGAQAYEDCSYALGPDSAGTFTQADLNAIDVVFKNGRACPSGPATLGANFGPAGPPSTLTDALTGISLIENINLRPAEPVAPGVNPYRQHEYTAGWDYELSPTLAFEVRYDRRRLDHVIEDSSLSDPTYGEIYAVVNPGQGVDRTLDGYAAYLQSLGQAFLVPGESFNGSANFGTCPTCPPQPAAVRNYDGVEFRLTKNMSHNFSGMFSYTWSSLWGNYTGLTTTDQNDGDAPGRDSPDTTRAFDEPFYYFKDNGQSINGPLPTDRPNTFKGYGYYTLPWGHGKTTFGIFQYLYQGTPMSSYIDEAAALPPIPYESVYLFGHGMWSNVTTDPSGNITFGTPYARRTPWYTQTDFNLGHEFQVGEGKTLKFEGSVFNLWNQHAVLQYYEGINAQDVGVPLAPGFVTQNCPSITAGGPAALSCPVSLSSGASLYNTLEHPYNPQAWVNGVSCGPGSGTTCISVPRVTKSSWYGEPNQYQLTRNMLLTVTYQF